jgi:hypothetical protein
MSVREKPVANRHLDLINKDEAYRKHVSAVASLRPSINNVQPDFPPRLRVAAIANQRHRQNLLQSYAKHAQMIAEATRPGVAPRTRSTRRGLSPHSHPKVQQPEFEMVPAPVSPPSSRRQGPMSPRITTPGSAPRVSVRIGFDDQPIVTEETDSTIFDE